VASFIRRGLSADKFLVDVAPDGQSGLELAVSKDYSLIVLDLMLPGMTGQDGLGRSTQNQPSPFQFSFSQPEEQYETRWNCSRKDATTT
jgi:DNA-binding response OmpR family regulator